MTGPDKYSSIDVSLLRQQLSFEYLQLFEVEDWDGSLKFNEYPVPSEVATPKDTGFYLVTSRALMRLGRGSEQSVVCIPKNELRTDWEFNIIAVRLLVASVTVLLLFHARQLPSGPLEVGKMSAAINGR